jgi:hypothetical protein
MTGIHEQPGLLAIVVLRLSLPRQARWRGCTSSSQALLRGRAGRSTRRVGGQGSLDRLTCAADALAVEPAT